MSNLVSIGSALPSTQEFATLKEMGQMAIKSGFLPQGIRSPEQAIVIMLKGRELGIPPMQAFSSISVINGKPTMSAELMLSMIYRNVPHAIVNFLESTNEKCVIEALRPGGKPTIFSFTMEDAKRANLASKGPWLTYPAAMLRARCISSMARAMFPDALSGVVYTPEELGAEVDEEGHVQSAPVAEAIEVEGKKVAALPPEDPSEYKVTFGPTSMRGKTLGEINAEALASFLCEVEEGAKKQTKPINQRVTEFMQKAHQHLENVGRKEWGIDE